MTDLAVGFGLVLVFEGLLWALAPGSALRALKAMEELPLGQLKTIGLAVMAFGVFIVWLARG